MNNWLEMVTVSSEQAETENIPPGEGTVPGHKDGWGMAISKPGRTAMVPLVRQLGLAHESVSYRESLCSLPAQPDIFRCHLRKASDIIPITLSNMHPFVHNV